MKQREVFIKSTMDGTMQPSLFYNSDSKGKRPLLIGLHTWSWQRDNPIKVMLPYAEKYDFNLLLPEFRGNNLKTNPNCTQACGSDFAKQDIKDAVDYILANYDNIDEENIFLLGCSGGGHMALLMAGYCPEYFKAVGAYVPITDLEEWTHQKESYREHVLACCNNDKEEMKKRSPMSYIDTIAKANVKIFHGKYDTVVPFTHSVKLFNAINEKYPESKVYLDIFDGKHQIVMDTAMYWFLSQYKEIDIQDVTG